VRATVPEEAWPLGFMLEAREATRLAVVIAPTKASKDWCELGVELPRKRACASVTEIWKVLQLG
jgi:hypothetical protein